MKSILLKIHASIYLLESITWIPMQTFYNGGHFENYATACTLIVSLGRLCVIRPITGKLSEPDNLYKTKPCILYFILIRNNLLSVITLSCMPCSQYELFQNAILQSNRPCTTICRKRSPSERPRLIWQNPKISFIPIYSQLSLNKHLCKTDTWCISDRDHFLGDDGFIIFYCFKYDAWSVLYFAACISSCRIPVRFNGL